MEPLRLATAQKELGISRSTLKRWILNGHIKTVTTRGGHHRIPPSEIERLRNVAPSEFSDKSSAPFVPVGRPCVLVVDDIKDTRDLLVKLLEDEGYDVKTAAEATEALQLAQDLHIDAYVLDNVIASTSGIDLCRRIRENDLTTPIVFYSGYDEREKALKAQAQAYVLKPQFDELLKTIYLYLGNKSAPQRRVLG